MADMKGNQSPLKHPMSTDTQKSRERKMPNLKIGKKSERRDMFIPIIQSQLSESSLIRSLNLERSSLFVP